MELHYIIIIIVVIFILATQVKSSIETFKQIKLYGRIFGEKEAYEYKLEDGFYRATGFSVKGGSNDNTYFKRINSSINKYVANNESIDFQLLKDTIDANCDSVEEDIHSQIPIPLYLGLAGTMLGIIIGVGYLWISGDLESLLSVNPNSQTTNNTEGIVVLLGGIAIAMICSLIGLIMTTFFTWQFKGSRLIIEQRKAELYAWLQQNLLPKVATSDLQAISNISNSLIKFNSTFQKHADEFTATLESVQTIMSQQERLAEVVALRAQEADAMAVVNAQAVEKLAQSGDKINQFADYLDAIRTFTEKFKEETLRLGALEEIRDFFLREKEQIELRNGEMSKRVGTFDNEFVNTMEQLRESMKQEHAELEKLVGQRTKAFEEGIKAQEDILREANTDIRKKFEEQLKSLPQAVSGINSLTSQIEELLKKIDSSNQKLLNQLTISNNGHSHHEAATSISQPSRLVIPSWLKWLIAVGIIVITGASIFNSYNTWKMSRQSIETTPSQDFHPQGIDTPVADTTAVSSEQKIQKTTPPTQQAEDPKDSTQTYHKQEAK